MIELVFDGENYYKNKKIENFEELSKKLLENRKKLGNLELSKIVGVINHFSQKLLKNSKTKNIEGIAFLSQWFRRSNIEKIIHINFENQEILGESILRDNKMLIAQPKGIVGHWIAGNVVTLGIFSLIQSIIVKNANIMRIPKRSLPVVIDLFKTLADSEYEGVSGKDLLSSTSIIYFTRADEKFNREFSLLCDARIIWGGEEAVKTISNIPKKETCEDIIFGPKYSFSIIDNETITDDISLKKAMDRLAYDVIFAEQNSCTSPQVLICEIDYRGLDKVMKELKRSFETLPQRYKKVDISMFQASNIIKARSEYAMDEDKNLLISKDNDWTILKDKNMKLEDPVKSRTIFIKSCVNLNDVLDLITPKIQTIGYAFMNKKKIIELGRKLCLKGVSRIVPLGQMNYYDAPWDGKLLLTRLVNINSLKLLPDT